MNHYDYIISGAGASGMSLLYRMMQHEFFSNKKILVVDKAPKNNNDHTWCFWEKQSSIFESIVHHKWQNMHFYSDYFSALLDLSPYQYKMIRSIDLYNLVMQEAGKYNNINFLYGNVSLVGNEDGKALLKMNEESYTADYIFNSILFEKIVLSKGKHLLLQHFKGFLIETTKPAFNPTEATLMDFRISQQHGTTFMYVLPVTDKKALIEYTLFTKDLLAPEKYSKALNNYIKNVLQIQEYNIVEEEFGVIPMTNFNFAKQNKRVINMGTAGGQTKASTGYTFTFIQKQCDKIIDHLLTNKPLENLHFTKSRFDWYDSIFLNVLANNRVPGNKIFSRMFQKNETYKVLEFLDNESNLAKEINIIRSLPTLPFLKAAWQETLP